jgi:hypothetical protein
MKEKKINILFAYMRNDNWPSALRLAASFPRLGEHKAAIVRAHKVLARPGFYAQLGYLVLRQFPDVSSGYISLTSLPGYCSSS